MSHHIETQSAAGAVHSVWALRGARAQRRDPAGPRCRNSGTASRGHRPAPGQTRCSGQGDTTCPCSSQRPTAASGPLSTAAQPRRNKADQQLPRSRTTWVLLLQPRASVQRAEGRPEPAQERPQRRAGPELSCGGWGCSSPAGRQGQPGSETPAAPPGAAPLCLLGLWPSRMIPPSWYWLLQGPTF